MRQNQEQLPVRWNAETDPSSHRCCVSECLFKVVLEDGEPVTKHCWIHGGVRELTTHHTTSIYNFRAMQVRNSIARLANHEQRNSLEVDLGVLRETLERIVNQCENSDAMWVAMAPNISDLVIKIKHLLEAKVKIDQQFSKLLTIEQVKKVAGDLVNSVNVHVNNPDLIQKIMEDFQESLKTHLTPKLED